MTQPLLGQRSRGELIAELYDRHAAGLFAYCHDQLGDPGSAAAALVAVLTAVPDIEPPRAALYAFARREIHLRDVVHAPPAADADPVSSFVERVLRDLRPHQREVLYLSGVCEMDTSELSWVLDVAADTADELTVSACRRFAQSLSLALPSARVPDHLAEVFGALSVAPIRDVLVRAPWATPPATLRTLALGSPSTPAVAPPPPVLQVKPLWPTAPSWPPPPAGAGARTGPDAFSPPDRFPDPFSDPFPDPFSAPEPGVVSAHEAATEPMPKLRDAILTALDDAAPRARRARLQRPRPRGAAPLPAKAPQPPAPQPPTTQSPSESPLAAAPSPRPAAPPLPAPLPADVLDDPPAPTAGLPPLEDLFRPLAPETRAALAYTDKLVAAAPREEPIPAAFATWPMPVAPPELPDAAPVPAAPGGAAQAQPPLPGWPLRPDELDGPAQQDRTASVERPDTGWMPPAERPATDRTTSPERPGTGWMPPAEQPGTDRTASVERPGTGRGPYTRRPRHAAPSGVARPDAPAPAPEAITPDTADTARITGAAEAEAGTAQISRPTRAGRRARRRHRAAGGGHRHRHYDWIWELVGFLICVAIAMIVFFAVPTIVTP
ncbi:hypothetical protein [Streptosporangium roseum]|uniref:hypothetical protein n=1 Tax=Streptosporangium roseum TaxID=2001 RepID=UPI0004CCAA61|nr:hypothetical protein [Streptosporangium roseum]